MEECETKGYSAQRTSGGRIPYSYMIVGKGFNVVLGDVKDFSPKKVGDAFSEIEDVASKVSRKYNIRKDMHLYIAAGGVYAIAVSFSR